MSIALTVQAMAPRMVPTRFSELVQQVCPLSSRRCAASAVCCCCTCGSNVRASPPGRCKLRHCTRLMQGLAELDDGLPDDSLQLATVLFDEALANEPFGGGELKTAMEAVAAAAPRLAADAQVGRCGCAPDRQAAACQGMQEAS